MTSLQKTTRGQAGFTLVELAIVMIIIGLLIAGVLKGQALITNAQVAATVAQAKAIDAATTSFKDQYAGLPGDLPTPATRIPNCTGVCAVVGNGDGILTGALPGAAPTGEEKAYFPQLAADGLLTGLNGTAAACTAIWGDCYPAAKIGGGFNPGWSGGGAALTGQVGGPVVAGIAAGLYLTLADTSGAAMSVVAGALPLTANNADRIDTKMDDGIPTTGVVMAGGNAACVAGAGAAATYAESVAAKNCGVYVKIQN